ncbi:hypothetical protein BJV78DRAFT_125116 [Lactifluus subvellereus]|nr:hypothetical protein BJV78DRAFT_125116 [Lactifluus subvellereus]
MGFEDVTKNRFGVPYLTCVPVYQDYIRLKQSVTRVMVNDRDLSKRIWRPNEVKVVSSSRASGSSICSIYLLMIDATSGWNTSRRVGQCSSSASSPTSSSPALQSKISIHWATVTSAFLVKPSAGLSSFLLGSSRVRSWPLLSQFQPYTAEILDTRFRFAPSPW